MWTADLEKTEVKEGTDARENSLKTFAQHSLYGRIQPAAPEAGYGQTYASVTEQRDPGYVARKLYGFDNDTAVRETDAARCARAEEFNSPNLMPTRATMVTTKRTYFTDPQAVEKLSANTKPKMSAQTKILIASYAAVVLALVLIITLTTVSIAGLFGSVNELQSQYDTRMQEIAGANYDSEYGVIGSDEYAINFAEAELGMRTPSPQEVRTYPPPILRDEPVYNSGGNWFDDALNWFKNLFS